MNEMDLSPTENKVYFGQLLGMCDQISFPLGVLHWKQTARCEIAQFLRQKLKWLKQLSQTADPAEVGCFRTQTVNDLRIGLWMCGRTGSRRS